MKVNVLVINIYYVTCGLYVKCLPLNYILYIYKILYIKSGLHEFVTLHGKRDFADFLKNWSIIALQ